MLEVSGLTVDLGHRVLVADASFHVAPGEKVAMVGPNGAGKTSLLRAIAGELTPAAGGVRLPVRWGWLQQDVQARPEDAPRLALDHLLAARDTAGLARDVEAARRRIDSTDGIQRERAVRRFAPPASASTPRRSTAPRAPSRAASAAASSWPGCSTPAATC